jgi:leucine efflux protein
VLGITDLPTYLVGLVLIILLPGPNSLYVLSVAARRGVRSGYAGAAGVWTGDAVLMTLSAAGVASLLQANPAAFAVVKWAGASYLLWLAIGMLRAAWTMWRSRVPVADQIADAAVEAGVEPQARGERPYRRALVISLLNPKAILFFVAFFVQFVDPAYAHPVLSFLVSVRCSSASRSSSPSPLPERAPAPRDETGPGSVSYPRHPVRGRGERSPDGGGHERWR